MRDDAMNTVIEFPRNRISTAARAAPRAPAEVVIFPGVRVERTPFSLADRILPVMARGSSAPQIKEIETV